MIPSIIMQLAAALESLLAVEVKVSRSILTSLRSHLMPTLLSLYGITTIYYLNSGSGWCCVV